MDANHRFFQYRCFRSRRPGGTRRRPTPISKRLSVEPGSHACLGGKVVISCRNPEPHVRVKMINMPHYESQ